ncbi:hypothetical protein ACOCJ5_06760 [Knoellia sp. CPCC 206450]|uniref:hypothetical protein n=1 Tax=Knoellia tibetensis TaxID=3404798 RepID=UPI003B433C91
MIALDDVLLMLGLLACGTVVGAVAAAVAERSAARGATAARAGRAVTVPVLVGSGEAQRRGRAFVDGDDVVVIGPGTHLRVSRAAFRSTGQRRVGVNEELLEFAEQRGFVDAAGGRHLVGAVEEWGPALEAQLDRPPRPAGRWRRLRAALPTTPLVLVALALLAFTGFQALWAMGHDVDATLVRLVDHPDEGYTDCGVRWPAPGGADALPNYAEIDCYEPFPAVGDTVRIRALASPLEGSALDHEGTYEGLTLITGLAAIASGVGVVVGATARLRRPPVRLAPIAAAAVTVAPPVEVSSDADLLALLDALAVREGWQASGTGAAPDQPAYAPLLMALGSARWWPAAVLAAGAWLVDGIPGPLRAGLAAGAAAALAWAGWRALTTWLAVRRAAVGPVTSEWDYRLIRDVGDEWFALLLLGRTPHWMVLLDEPGHPPVSGRCGVRGDLQEGGAVHLRINGEFWPTMSPVVRVDDDIVSDMRHDVLDRLRGTQG